ncbi:MAG TPA: hypothetical protein PLR18_02275 [bacterium]|nr:hypothetical protein [bacterium]
MPSVRIFKEQKDQIYFITFTIHNWYHILDRHGRFKLLEDSFVYCQKHKGLKVYAFVFMTNHLHFVGSAPDLIGTIRDMKTFLSKELQKNILAAEPEVNELFRAEDGYHLWQDGNYPELITSEEFLDQKINYIHDNPVRKEYVHYPEDWKWSSASKISTKIIVESL